MSAGIEFIRAEVSGLAWDGYDSWGSLRSAQFDIAESWYAATRECLRGFRPGLGGVDVSDDRKYRLSQAMADEIIINRDDVEYWWRILDRMEALIIRAGQDY